MKEAKEKEKVQSRLDSKVSDLTQVCLLIQDHILLDLPIAPRVQIQKYIVTHVD